MAGSFCDFFDGGTFPIAQIGSMAKDLAVVISGAMRANVD
jgi:hypothetical protein